MHAGVVIIGVGEVRSHVCIVVRRRSMLVTSGSSRVFWTRFVEPKAKTGRVRRTASKPCRSTGHERQAARLRPSHAGLVVRLVGILICLSSASCLGALGVPVRPSALDGILRITRSRLPRLLVRHTRSGLVPRSQEHRRGRARETVRCLVRSAFPFIQTVSTALDAGESRCCILARNGTIVPGNACRLARRRRWRHASRDVRFADMITFFTRQH